jgi:hypothetical protein
VAHVRAVGQVVCAKFPGEELIKKRCLVAEPSRGVKCGLVRAREIAELGASQFEGILPRDRNVFVARSLVAHWLGEAASVLKREIGPAHQLGHGVRGEELTAHAFLRHLPGGVLDPILANVEMQAVPIVRLGAAGTVEATILVVHLEDDPCAIDEFPLFDEDARDAVRGAPSCGGMVIVFLREFTAGIRAEADGGHGLRFSGFLAHGVWS